MAAIGDWIHWSASGDVLSVVDVIWGPALDALTRLPGWTLLPLGLVIILLSFRLLDSVLPQLDGERHGSGKGAWMKRPWPMFGLGCLVGSRLGPVVVRHAPAGPLRVLIGATGLALAVKLGVDAYR